MKVCIPLTQDSANSYVNSRVLYAEDLGDELRLGLDDPERVVTIQKKDFRTFMRMLED
jgi:hypothetical protein